MAPRPDGSLATLRVAPLLLLGFAGAFRRSELVALDVADVEEVPEGRHATLIRNERILREGAPDLVVAS